MNKSLKVMLLAGVLAAGAFGAEARDRGPGDGVEIINPGNMQIRRK